MKNIIKKIKEYYPVSDEALEALTAEFKMVQCKKNTYIVRSGYIDHRVYFIEEGVTRSVFHKEGNDTTTWFSMEGDITFGMYSLYHNQPSVESVETLTDCTFYTISIDALNKLYERHIDIANWGRVAHQDNNRLLSHIFVERLQMSPRERYNCFMQHFPGLLNRVKLKHVAEFLGISIYTLSRIRKNG
ncbi:MAG: cyclic nucleotide-binding domain-containing protein [Bacteroidaceae bacterium]|nr:cyclic nucleotide-binding domain-containing protein [Bacteroidaceae bacterium]